MFAINGTKLLALAGFSSPLSTAGECKYLLASSFLLFSAKRRNSRSLLNALSAPSLGDGGSDVPLPAGLPAQAAVLVVVRVGCSAWEGVRVCLQAKLFGSATCPKINQGLSR